MLLDEHVVTFTEATAIIPKFNGRKMHASSLWRWARKGVRGVRLETLRLGGRYVTTVEAIERFAKTLSQLPAATEASHGQHARHTPRKACRQAQIARTLDAARI